MRGDGGVYTSLDDYEKWLRGIDEQKLLSKASYEAMFSPQVLTDRNGAHYGYGWFIDEYRGEPRIHHNGETLGFRACVQRFPKRDAAIFFQLNGEIEGKSEKLTKFGERLADILIFGTCAEPQAANGRLVSWLRFVRRRAAFCRDRYASARKS